MLHKGITRGDNKYRHFTFNDEDIVTRGRVKYYKVNYGKNKLEGEFAEDEIGFVPCDNVIILGQKPKPATPAPTPVVEPEPEPVKDEKPKKTSKKTTEPKAEKKTTKKTTRTTKVEILPVENETIPVAIEDFKYEYSVKEIFSDNITELENQLNDMGNDGWEMCGFDTNRNLLGKIHIISIFKRKRS